ncbi:MAG TPA: 2TM domain-containing protein [Acidimicrobiales bacterium]|jgi:hypothetical protein
MTGNGIDRESEEWKQAHKRVALRRAFRTHLVVYVVINAFLIGVWALSGAGYFWPVWVLAGWGIGLALHAWKAYGGGGGITDADVEAELRRRQS